MLVPLFPTYNSAAEAGIAPAQPSTSTTRCAASWRTPIPSRPSDSIITCVSSLSSAPVSVELPRASAAQTSARLVMLLEPGGRIEPRAAPIG